MAQAFGYPMIYCYGTGINQTLTTGVSRGINFSTQLTGSYAPYSDLYINTDYVPPNSIPAGAQGGIVMPPGIYAVSILAALTTRPASPVAGSYMAGWLGWIPNNMTIPSNRKGETLDHNMYDGDYFFGNGNAHFSEMGPTPDLHNVMNAGILTWTPTMSTGKLNFWFFQNSGGNVNLSGWSFQAQMINRWGA